MIRVRVKNRAKSLIAWMLPASEQRVVRQALWIYAIRAVHILGGLVTLPLSVRILGAEGFGVLTVIIAVARLIYGLASTAGGEVITTFVMRSVAEGRSEAASIFRFALIASVGLSFVAYAVIAVLTFTAGSLLEIDPEYRHLMLLYGMVGLLTAVNRESQAVLRLADRLQLGLGVIVVVTLGRIGLLAAVWLTGGGIMEVVLVYVAVSAVNGLGMFAVATASAPLAGLAGFWRSMSLRVSPEVVRFYIGRYWESGINMVLMNNLDILLLARFADSASVGLYGAAWRLVNMVRDSIEPVRAGATLEYSRLWYSGRGAELRRVALSTTVLSCALFAAGLGLLALFREPIIRLFLGGEFAGVAPLLLISILGTLNSAPAFISLPAAVGRVGPLILSATARLAVFLAAMLWMVPEHGAEGMAWARTISGLVGLLIITSFAISILRQSYRLRHGIGQANTQQPGT